MIKFRSRYSRESGQQESSAGGLLLWAGASQGTKRIIMARLLLIYEKAT